MSYLLDANVFMSAKNLHYGLDFCPAFWDWLVHKGNTGSVFSIDKGMFAGMGHRYQATRRKAAGELDARIVM